MELPTGIQIKRYVKGDHLRVKYRFALPAAIFLYVFSSVWIGIVIVVTLSGIFTILGYEFPYFRIIENVGNPSSLV